MINKEKFNFEEDINIDPDALDVEWLRQSNLYIKYSEALSKARRYLDKLKDKLDVMRSEFDLAIRKDPAKYFGKDFKLTENAVQSKIMSFSEYREVQENILEAKYNVDVLSAAVRSLEQKKESLENLVKLLGMQYFASPKEPRNLGFEYDKTVKQRATRSEIAKTMNSFEERRRRG